MENVQTSVKKLRFFTKEEIQTLTPYITGKEKISMVICETLAKKFNRKPYDVYQYVYRKKKKADKNNTVKDVAPKKAVADKTVTRDKSVVNSTPMFKHGEFIIPVSSWEVRNTNGSTSLVLKFEKSI